MPKLDEGLIYRVKHYRRQDAEGEILPKGGVTIVELGRLVDAVDGTKRFVPSVMARADCSPKDSYNRKRGRDIALGRALKIYGG